MPSLLLRDNQRLNSEIISAILAREDHRSFVFTPNEDPKGPTFAKVNRVANWGWVRRIACGYGEPNLVHPIAGCAISVEQWRYGKARHLGMGSTGPLYAAHDTFDPIMIVRLSDGRIFADQWASADLLYESLSRWRNAGGYLASWRGIGFDVTGCIGGLDWQTIGGKLEDHHARIMRERRLAEERAADDARYHHPLTIEGTERIAHNV